MSYADKRPRRPVSERDGDDTLRHSDQVPAPDAGERTTRVVPVQRGAKVVDRERFEKCLVDEPEEALRAMGSCALCVAVSAVVFALVVYVGWHAVIWWRS